MKGIEAYQVHPSSSSFSGGYIFRILRLLFALFYIDEWPLIYGYWYAMSVASKNPKHNHNYCDKFSPTSAGILSYQCLKMQESNVSIPVCTHLWDIVWPRFWSSVPLTSTICLNKLRLCSEVKVIASCRLLGNLPERVGNLLTPTSNFSREACISC